MRKRFFQNPVIGDKAVLVRSAEETGGEYTLFQIEVVPGGGTDLHSHEDYSEKFEVLKGELSLQLAKQHYVLRKGEAMVIPRKTMHCFSNNSNEPVKFKVEFRPAQPGFEKAIAIGWARQRWIGQQEERAD